VSRIEGLLRQKIAGRLPDLSETIQLVVHLTYRRNFGPVIDEALTLFEIEGGRYGIE
jgi:hypothetical protein